MATKKKAEDKCVYRGETYTVLEQNEKKVKLTDGVIHFWVKAKDVKTGRDN